MKRLFLLLILTLIAAAVFSQDMSYYIDQFMLPDGTFSERRAILEQVRDEGATGIGDFYHEALKFFLLRAPNIRTRAEQNDAEISALILCNGLAAEKYEAAASDLWQIVELYDISKSGNNGIIMQAALIAVGQTKGNFYIPHIVQRLNELNDQIKAVSDPENRSKIQLAATGCINALESLKDIRGYKPIFFAFIGVHDTATRQAASNALVTIVDDPCDVIIEIIQDPRSTPREKLTALQEMMKNNAPDSSKSKVACAAFVQAWNYITQDRSLAKILSEMRKEANTAIGRYGVTDASIYPYIERSYSSNFISSSPDNDEVVITLNTLTFLKTNESVGLLYKFLNELNGRRRNGPWFNKERQYFEWITQCLGKAPAPSNEVNVQVRILLTSISRNERYTAQERTMARNALNSLNQ